ncbi:MAG: twin-arginine translocase subunit TatC [Candidatus Paracaedibacteraceae bacterium]|nr:twin-arginine translocase subunit TatC [Candidatus Paracaedibacteraceae bacterium]
MINTSTSIDSPRPFWQHVIELRTAVIVSLSFFLICTLVAYYFSEPIFHILVSPLEQLFAAKGEVRRFIYTSLTEAFVTYLKVALFAGLFFTFPFIALQAWLFVSPGLYKRERGLFFCLLFSVPFFFVIGALFAYYIVLPAAFSFFLSFETMIGSIPLQLETKMSEYLSLVMRLLLAFGFSFELPVVLAGLAWLGVLSKETLIKRWRLAVVGVTFLAAVITPPDALSMIFLALPLLLLYAISIVIIHFIEKHKRHA